MNNGSATSSRPIGALLTNADFYGTLASARALGAEGIPVTVAHDSMLGAAGWSKHVSRTVRCPPIGHPTEFLAWLRAFGRASPGQVLIPASDDAAFLYAANREVLAEDFQISSPSLDAVYGLLNKRRLYEHAAAAGLSVPRTWCPDGPEAVAHIAREAHGPLMIKPQTQILLASHRKGELVTDPSQLAHRYAAFSRERYAPELVAIDPGVVWPLIQEFHPIAGSAIYSLSGYISEEGGHALRGARKVLQLPRRIGIGIAFEDEPVDPVLAAGIVSLCRKLDYHGIFEAEFICAGKQRLLIDFNPRLFGQLGFDLARGLPLVTLAYQEARGHGDQVERLLRDANDWPAQTDASPVYVHRNAMELMLRWQEASGAMGEDDVRHWRDWISAHAQVDAVTAPDDWAPALVDLVSRLAGYARHPRAFVRSVVLNR